MMLNVIKGFLDINHILYETDVKLKRRTWIHRGGIANIFVIPQNEQDLCVVISYLYKNNIQFLLIGHTSNLYILNSTDIPVVVSTLKCYKYVLNKDRLYCEAGVGVIRLSSQMLKRGIKGFEYLTGLPGTVAAALVNNSSCNNNSISQLLISAKILLRTGEIVIWTPDDFEFSYRSSRLKRKEVDGCILSIILRAESGSSDKLLKIAEGNQNDRDKRIDGYSNNLGCTFNSPGCLGSMRLKYRIVEFLIHAIGKLFRISNENVNLTTNKILCKMSHCEEALPYISTKNTIVYLWKDEGADSAFPVYCRFMREVYRTDKLEIEIIK